jgi:hypothetical protein
MLIFREKLTKLAIFDSPISRGATTIIPLRVVLSRKIFKKVTNRIFAPGTITKPASTLENRTVIPLGEQP